MSLIPNRDMRSGMAYMHQKDADGTLRPWDRSSQVLAVLLNDGTCPRTAAKIQGKAMVDEMFRNRVADFPDFGWGITLMQANGTATGRSESTVHWAGLANLWWWCDREKGIAGMVVTKITPFGDGKMLELWGGVEAAVYEASKA
ncbi:beta-lactamase family protein [Plectosphaerella cucumerina]|uniref:Beta-lactamase family protein n=1 Tax=Plectosphaerella cucumerina TaxID=40658 RepID=A0A8K0XAI6_9PEZI|nr:beta-lactamase family protein [Plectosphaerella cucumerina]